MKTPVAAAAAASLFALSGPAAGQEFAETDIYFELNATDGDVGLHGKLDADAWKTARIAGPGGAFDVIRAISNQDSPEFGMTELFFESNEPPLDDRSFQELIALFPPGVYQFTARTTDNVNIAGSDTLSTALPCPPAVSVISDAEGDLYIRWRLFRGTFDPDAEVCSTASRVVADRIEAVFEISNDETGFSRVFSVELGPSARRVEIPDEFLQGVDPDAVDAKAEVVVIAPDGNRTAAEVDVEL
jgi:hypothetical protein